MPEPNQTLSDRIRQTQWQTQQPQSMNTVLELGNLIAACVLEIQINSFQQLTNILQDQLSNLNQVSQQNQQYRRVG